MEDGDTWCVGLSDTWDVERTARTSYYEVAVPIASMMTNTLSEAKLHLVKSKISIWANS